MIDYEAIISKIRRLPEPLLREVDDFIDFLQFGDLKAQLERAGNVVADLDLQIASIALQYNLPLVTHTRQHFERISGRQIEDWL